MASIGNFVITPVGWGIKPLFAAGRFIRLRRINILLLDFPYQI